MSRISTPRFASSATYASNGTASSGVCTPGAVIRPSTCIRPRSEEHTSELQSRPHLVCRLLLEKKKKKDYALRVVGKDTPHTAASFDVAAQTTTLRKP